jgi:hypothetical protein
MLNQHTPGPWVATEERGTEGELCFLCVRDQNGDAIASTWAGHHEANDRLIAAAPELLATLETLVTSYLDDVRDYQRLFNATSGENKWIGDPLGDAEVVAALAAITKATGGAA